MGTSWRLDETFIKVAGQWKYLYRAVDKTGDTVDFLLTVKRDKGAAQRYLERPETDCSNRDHAHDQEGAAALPRWTG